MAIEIADIATCWEQIKPGLEVIKARTNAVWSLDDVYSHCYLGEWLLFVEPGIDGFLMVSARRCNYSGVCRLEVNCAYHRGESDPTQKYLPFLIQLARQMGAVSIDAHSPRRGWERKGFEVADVLYRMEIDS